MIEEIGGDFLQWLRGFYWVANTRSVSRASVEMGRKQPAISHQIKCLENNLGVKLFDRTSGKMELRPEGKVLLEKTISLFEIMKELKAEISVASLENKGKVIIVAGHSIIHFFLPKYVTNFRKNHPEVQLSIEGGGLEMILSRIESAEADMGIADPEVVPDTVVSYDLFEAELKSIAAKGSRFFSTSTPTLKEISQAPFIFFPPSSTTAPIIQKRFAQDNLRLNVALVLNTFQAVKHYVALNLGVSIIDDYTLSKKDLRTLDVYSLSRFFKKRTYCLLLRKRKYLSPAAKAFIRTIKPSLQF